MVLSPNLDYRRDIDGLRAIAVMSVIFSHTGSAGFYGGFVGVDIFFVLSGYLISQRIIYAHINGGFSYKYFYNRRIRRLFPAMFVTIFVSLLVGIQILTPDQLIGLSQTAIGAVFSFSNVQFFLQAGYWDTSSLTKPLLHTWSLGVEEQFYIFWPLVIAGILRFPGRQSLHALIALCGISIIITSIATKSNPDAAFYLTPFRIYEFAIGTACVWFDSYKWPNSIKSQTVRFSAFVLGLSLIGISVTSIKAETAFPGWVALIPAMGTALVIIAKAPPKVSFLLTNTVSTYLGLISYSLYLIHWPVLIFLQLHIGKELNLTWTLYALLSILILSSLQYHFIETPLRRPRPKLIYYPNGRPDIFKTLIGASFAAVVIICTASALISLKGLPHRFAKEIQWVASLDIQRAAQDRVSNIRAICGSRLGKICGAIDSGKINALIVGDSHGVDGANIFLKAFPDINYLYVARGGCPLLLDLEGITYSFRECSKLNDQRIRDIKKVVDDIDFVVFSQRMNVERIEAMKEMIKWFSDRGVIPIVLGAGPHFSEPVIPLILAHGTSIGLNEAIYQGAHTEQFTVDHVLGPFTEALGGAYLTKTDYFCPNELCNVVIDDHVLLVLDQHHLSLESAQMFGVFLSSTQPNLFFTNKTGGRAGGVGVPVR